MVRWGGCARWLDPGSYRIMARVPGSDSGIPREVARCSSSVQAGSFIRSSRFCFRRTPKFPLWGGRRRMPSPLSPRLRSIREHSRDRERTMLKVTTHVKSSAWTQSTLHLFVAARRLRSSVSRLCGVRPHGAHARVCRERAEVYRAVWDRLSVRPVVISGALRAAPE